MSTVLVLGADGRIHAGGASLAGFFTDCHTTSGLRTVMESEAERMDEDRVCTKCFKRIADGGTLRCPHCDFVTEGHDEYVTHLTDHYPDPGKDHG